MERSLGHRAPLLWLLMPFACGIALGRVWAPSPVALGVAAALGILAGLAGARRDSRAGFVVWACGVCVSVCSAGIAWLGVHNSWIPEWQYLPPREATLDLSIARTFPQPEGRDEVSGLATVVSAAGTASEIAGHRLCFSARPGEGVPVRRGSTVRVKGVLESIPREPEPGGFDEYLVNAGAQFRLGRGRALEELSPPGPIKRLAGAVAGRMERALSSGLGDQPHLKGIYLAMLLGRKAELGPVQEAVFLQSGTLHLFAISGLHIGAMALALHGALMLARVPRRAAAIAQLLMLWIYVEATGAPPSAVRAWAMIAFLRAGQEFRWPGNAVSAITASAIAVLLADPHQLFGASFQMSYAVVASLLLIGIPLSDRVDTGFKPFSSLPEPTWQWWRILYRWAMRDILKTVAICFAATLVSMPMAVGVFGWFTPGSFFANLLVVPMALLVVPAGFCAICTGLAGIPWLPELFNHAGALVLAIMEWILETVVRVPGIATPAEYRTDWAGPALVVALLVFLLLGYERKWRGAIRPWMPAALVVVGMALAIRLVAE